MLDFSADNGKGGGNACCCIELVDLCCGVIDGLYQDVFFFKADLSILGGWPAKFLSRDIDDDGDAELPSPYEAGSVL